MPIYSTTQLKQIPCRCKLLKLTQKENDNLNNLVYIKEMEHVDKNLPTSETQGLLVPS